MDTIKKSKETKWITTLITAYLYGLNDEISDYIKSTKNEIVRLKYLFLK